MKILGFDPSINHTGWGIIDTDTSNGQPRLVLSGVVFCSTDQGNERYGLIAQELYEMMCAQDPDVAVVEWPTFEASARGRDLVKKKGLTKLCAVAGICVAAAALNSVPYHLVTAWEWKGKHTKPKIKARVEQLLGRMDWEREDEWEALGLALWFWKHKCNTTATT